MTRTVFRGGSVFDGTGSDPRAGRRRRGGRPDRRRRQRPRRRRRVDIAGRTLLPGLFDCHVHVTTSHVDLWRIAQHAVLYQFYEAARNLEATLRAGVTSVRDAGGADLGIQQALADGLIDGPRMQISLAMISQTGGHADTWLVSGTRVPCSRRTRACRRGSSTARTRCAARSASCTAWART